MNPFKTMIPILTTLVLFTAFACAQPADSVAPAKDQLFQKADVNQDGKATFEELKAVMPKLTQERFNKMDRNGDGVLTPDERKRSANKKAEGTKPEKARADKAKADKKQNVKPAAGEVGEKSNACKAAEKTAACNAAPTKSDACKPIEKADAEPCAASKEQKPEKSNAAAQSAASTPPDRARHLAAKMKAADLNKDGKISWEEAKVEFPRMTEEMFKKLDKDNDGGLTREEFRAALAARMKEADANKDGKVSFEEAKGAFPRMNENAFKKMDKNGDGFLTPDDRK